MLKEGPSHSDVIDVVSDNNGSSAAIVSGAATHWVTHDLTGTS